MNINFISVLLGCAGLVIGSIGLVAQDIHSVRQPPMNAETPQSATEAPWPPRDSTAGVEFHDVFLALGNLGPAPKRRTETPRQQSQSTPPDSEANIRLIRMLRAPGSRRTQLVEIEFVDHSGRSYLRRYPVNQETVGARGRPEDVESDPQALESYASPRRFRRYGRRRGW